MNDEFHISPKMCIGFGDVELVELVEFFLPILEKAGVHSDRIEVEWEAIKGRIYRE